MRDYCRAFTQAILADFGLLFVFMEVRTNMIMEKTRMFWFVMKPFVLLN